MSLTVNNQEYSVFGNKGIGMCDVDFDSSYPTGGESLTPGDVGLSKIQHIMIEGKSGYIFEYDYSNEKIKVINPTNIVAASGTVNDALGFATGLSVLNSETAARTVLDTGAEVANTTDLSGLTGVKIMAFGY